VEWPARSGEVVHLEVQVVPLTDANQVLLGASVSFVDVTRSRRYKEELEHANQGLEDAYAELQSTNEELETTNEELQSTVEELETTNEELQSTNEELETMNEELQSTNEELETMNDELRQRGDDLNSANAFLESVLTSLHAGVVVVDEELRIIAWNARAEDLWGLRQKEVSGKHLLNLDIGLPVERLKVVIRNCLNGAGDGEVMTLDAVNRRGKAIRCEVTCTPLKRGEEEVRGAILIMEDQGDGRSS
jgi:two-component system, chemotaxis family, CheB/CheR fusion protein